MNPELATNGKDFTETWGGSSPDYPTDLPELFINPHDPTATAKELAGIIARGTEFLFNGNTPVRITAEDDEMPRAIEVTNEAVRVVAHQLCVPIKLSTSRRALHKEPVPLSAEIAGLYLNGLEGRWGLKMFRGITTAPILSDNGEIRTADGYDSISRLWCYKVPTVAVVDRPTKDDALRALSFLRTVARRKQFSGRTDNCRLSPESRPRAGFALQCAKYIWGRNRQGSPDPGHLYHRQRCAAGGVHGGPR